MNLSHHFSSYFNYFWKCNFPMNHNVGLSVCLSVSLSVCLSVKKKVVRILGKCRVLLLKNSSPPLQLYKDKYSCRNFKLH